MKFRIAIWGVVGFFVSAWWVIYAFARTVPINRSEPLIWNLATLTEPIVLASLRFNFGLSFYSVLIANTATYALIGLAIESLRRQVRHGN